MSTEHARQNAEVQVIGSTIVAREQTLPRWLAPILRVTGAEDVYFLANPESHADPSAWDTVDRGWIDEELDAGSMMKIDPPIPWQDGHVLLQVELGSPPELVPAERLEDRLAEISRAALVRAGELLHEGASEQAARQAWRALRAARSGALLPLLVVIALGRGSLDDDELSELETRARQHGPAAISDVVEACREDDALAPLADLVQDDHLYEIARDAVASPVSMMPLGRPKYLRPYPQRRRFIADSRRHWYGA